MKYSIKVNEVRAKEGNNIKGFATVVFGDSFKITNIAILSQQSFVRNSIPVSLMPMQESRNRRKRRHRSRTEHRKCRSFP